MTAPTHIVSGEGLAFEELPIDTEKGFPQELEKLVGDTAYHFRLYVNLAAEELAGEREFFDLPGPEGDMVVRVERGGGAGGRETLFLRKVVPGLVYAVERIAFTFSELRVARANLNGRGRAGSRVSGRVASRWA